MQTKSKTMDTVEGFWSKNGHTNRRVNTMVGAFIVGAGMMDWYVKRKQILSLKVELGVAKDLNELELSILQNRCDNREREINELKKDSYLL